MVSSPSPQGRILADVVVSAQPDSLWLEPPASQAEAIASHLRKYLIADRVEMQLASAGSRLTLAGPGAAALLAAKAPGAAIPEAPWGHAGARVAGVEVTLQRTGRLGVPAFTVWVEEQEAAAVWQELLAGGGAMPVGHEALEVVRTEAGIGRFGQDFGPQSFPQETGAENEAVSYTKGCYLGQEVVARIHYRGGVQKSLCGLLLGGGDTAAAANAANAANAAGIAGIASAPSPARRCSSRATRSAPSARSSIRPRSIAPSAWPSCTAAPRHPARAGRWGRAAVSSAKWRRCPSWQAEAAAVTSRRSGPPAQS